MIVANEDYLGAETQVRRQQTQQLHNSTGYLTA